MGTTETIDQNTLARLVEAGAVRGASIIGQQGGWGVVIQYGMTERVLAAKRGAVRNFARFETLVSYLKKIGIAKYQVDATQYDPATVKEERFREGAAERMRRAHEAAGLERLLDERIQLADAPDSVWHDAEDVFAELAAHNAR